MILCDDTTGKVENIFTDAIALPTDSLDDIAQCPVWENLDGAIDADYTIRAWRNEDGVKFYVNPMHN